MKTIKIFTFILIFTTLLWSCWKHDDSRIIGNEDYRLCVLNNSSNTIYAIEGITYPDTIPDNYSPLNMDMYRAECGAKATLMIRCCWESFFQTRIDSDTLMVFIIDEEVLLNNPWDTVRKNYMILKRYDLSLQDLIDLDWTVTYP
jgi:hypothetical protein